MEVGYVLYWVYIVINEISILEVMVLKLFGIVWDRGEV